MDNWKYEQLVLALKNGWAKLCVSLVKKGKRVARVKPDLSRQLWLGLSCSVPKLGFWKRVFMALRQAFRTLIKSSPF